MDKAAAVLVDITPHKISEAVMAVAVGVGARVARMALAGTLTSRVVAAVRLHQDSLTLLG